MAQLGSAMQVRRGLTPALPASQNARHQRCEQRQIGIARRGLQHRHQILFFVVVVVVINFFCFTVKTKHISIS